MISLIIPNVNLWKFSATFDENEDNMETLERDNIVNIVRNNKLDRGTLLTGIIDKKIVKGSESDLVHLIYLEHGCVKCAEFLFDA